MVLKLTVFSVLVATTIGCNRISPAKQNAIAHQDIATLLAGTGANPDSVKYVSELWRGKLLVVVPGDSGSLAALSGKIGLRPASVPEKVYLTSEFPLDCTPEAGDFIARDASAPLLAMEGGRKIRDVYAMDPARRGVLCMILFYDREDGSYSTASKPHM